MHSVDYSKLVFSVAKMLRISAKFLWDKHSSHADN